MNSNPFDSYPKLVAAGLGYPNERPDADTQPTGWHPTSAPEIQNVSRETITEAAQARKAEL